MRNKFVLGAYNGSDKSCTAVELNVFSLGDLSVFSHVDEIKELYVFLKRAAMLQNYHHHSHQSKVVPGQSVCWAFLDLARGFLPK